ncbi:unnamed protein product [Malus baccata var. baccata]
MNDTVVAQRIMDKTWIHNPNRCVDEYLDGIEDFIEFAHTHNPGATRFRCPCRRCNNTLRDTIENVQFNLVRNGMVETYNTWNHHGEQLDNVSSSNATRVGNVEPNVDPSEQVMGIINYAFLFASTNTNQKGEDDVPAPMDSAEFEQYEKLLKNVNQELYPGCESFSILTAIVELMHGKIKYRMSNQCFDYFFGVFKRILPKDNCFLKDHRHAQKVLNGLELGYEKIHACKNNCILFYKENKALDKFHVAVIVYLDTYSRYMRWHKEKRVNDDVMKHPAYREAWKEFDRTLPKLAADPQNVRLGLATDGFNPFRVNQCLLMVLVDELKDLWTNGVCTYDKCTGNMLTLKAAVMWIVNDFSAYAMVSGWSTSGYMAFPFVTLVIGDGCHGTTSGKNDKEFDGKTEHHPRPKEWSGDQILEQLNRLDFAPFEKTMSTIIDIKGKTKNTIKARLDLERIGIQRGLWMNRDNDKARRDLAFFSMKLNDKKEFLKFVSSVKFPDRLLGELKKKCTQQGEA